MVRHCQYNAVDLLWRTDISGSCWITKPSSPWEADWSPTFANLCHLWHLHLYLATYVSGRTQPPPTFVFSTEPTRDWQMVKSESLMPTIPRYHPPPPHIGPVSWKNPIFKRDCARGSAPTELIQLFLKFCRYSCGGDRYRQRDILRSKQTEILPSTWFPFQILLIIYPSDHNLTWITTEELGIKTHIVIFISIIWYHIIFIGICLVRDFLTHQAMSR